VTESTLSPQRSKMHSAKLRLYYGACLVLIVFGAYSFSRAHLLKHTYPTILQIPMTSTGQFLQLSSLNSVFGFQTVRNPPGKRLLALYLSGESARTIQTALYCQYLLRTHKASTFAIALIVNPDAKALLRNLAAAGVHDTPIYIDQGHRYSILTGLPYTFDSTYLIEPSGQIDFAATGMALPITIRQLYERYELGTIQPTSGFDADISIIGQQLPDFRLTELWSNHTVRLNELLLSESPTHLFIFTAECAMCSLPHSLYGLHSTNSTSVVPIFSSRVPSPVLKRIAEEQQMKGPLYIATDQIPLVEDLYTNTAIAPYALELTLNKAGFIQSIFEQQ
jgi:hypothetical protein